MKNEQNYIRDLAEIRSMMERSSRFLSLSGWAGIMAGIYALAGCAIAYYILHFNPARIMLNVGDQLLLQVIALALAVLVLAVGTAVFLSFKKSKQRNEKLWNATARRLLIHMAVPLVAGGLLILIFLSQSLIGLIAPISLMFYGLALYNSGKFTYEEMKSLGLIEIALGLLACRFVEYALPIWALGFGVVHIIYGIYMHFKYER
jgi:hypothetical protein